MARRILARLLASARFVPTAVDKGSEVLAAESYSCVRELSGEIGKIDRDLTIVDARIISISDLLASQRREKFEWERKVDQAFAINRADLASAASIRANAASLKIVELEADLEELIPRAHGLRDKRKVLDKQRKHARHNAGMPAERPQAGPNVLSDRGGQS